MARVWALRRARAYLVATSPFRVETPAARSPAQRLATDGARAGVGIEEEGACDAPPEDIEQRLAHPVGCRPDQPPSRRFQPTPPGLTARESHGLPPNTPSRGVDYTPRSRDHTFLTSTDLTGTISRNFKKDWGFRSI